MSSGLNQLVSNFVQQSYVRAPDYLLYKQIKEALPTATYEELLNSITDNITIKPMLVQEITRRLNAATYIAKYSPEDNVVNVYVDYSNNSGQGVSPTPEVLAMSDCMAYVCFGVNDNNQRVTTITNFSSLSHPELTTKISECGTGNGMYYPVFVQYDTDEAEFSNLAYIYNTLAMKPELQL